MATSGQIVAVQEVAQADLLQESGLAYFICRSVDTS